MKTKSSLLTKLIALFLFAFSCVCTATEINIATPLQTLKDAAKEALINNPDLLAAGDSYQISLAEKREAFAGFLPKVNANFDYGPEQTFNSNTQADGHDDYVTLMQRNAGVSANQLIFDGGQVYNQYQQAAASAEATYNSYVDTRQNLLLTVVRVYTDILRLNKSSTAYNATYKTYEDVLDKTKKNYEAGAGQKPEVSLAESRVNQIKSSMINLKNQQAIAQNNFIKVIGVKPMQLVEVPIPTYRIPSSLMASEKIGLKNNPSLKAALLQIRANEYRVKVAKSQFYPKLNLNASANRGLNINGTEGSNNDQQIILDASYNLFNGGADKANLDQSRSQLMQSIHQYESIKRSVLANIQSAWETYQYIQQQIPKIQKTLKEDEYTAYAYNKQYLIGRRTLLDLLIVQGSVLSSKLALINAHYDLIVSSYTLLAAMGEIEESKI